MRSNKVAIVSVLLLIGLLIPKQLYAQVGTVKAYQKISDTQGNFTGVLQNLDVFGIDVASIGDLDGDGVTDIAVGATSHHSVPNNGGGAVWILFMNR